MLEILVVIAKEAKRSNRNRYILRLLSPFGRRFANASFHYARND
ncbi:MAG: hypothetical protein WBF90_00820 [Rivularia sp. (in: cyanobacteria)]